MKNDQARRRAMTLEAITLYLEHPDLPVAKIARMTGLTKPYLASAISVRGLSNRRPVKPVELHAQARKLYLEGYGIVLVGRELGIKPETIYSWIRDIARPRGEITPQTIAVRRAASLQQRKAWLAQNPAFVSDYVDEEISLKHLSEKWHIFPKRAKLLLKTANVRIRSRSEARFALNRRRKKEAP